MDTSKLEKAVVDTKNAQPSGNALALMADNPNLLASLSDELRAAVLTAKQRLTGASQESMPGKEQSPWI